MHKKLVPASVRGLASNDLVVQTSYQTRVDLSMEDLSSQIDSDGGAEGFNIAPRVNFKLIYHIAQYGSLAEDSTDFLILSQEQCRPIFFAKKKGKKIGDLSMGYFSFAIAKTDLIEIITAAGAANATM